MTDNQPITLSPEEYQSMMTELAGRDPLMRFLIQKQEQAQRDQAQRDAEAERPMRVVGGAA